MSKKCNICGQNTKLFMWLDKVPPLQNRFFDTAEASQNYQTTNIEYMHCISCDHIMIYKDLSVKFDPNYNNSDIASPVMLFRYSDVVSNIKKKLPDKKKKIIEVGCGRGELLYLLQHEGYVNLKGYDPASPVDNELITQKYWSYLEDHDVDCLILRHTLEEIPDVLDFVKLSVKALSDNGKIYCEITNVAELKNMSGVFSMYPEYHQLFSALSLSKLFALCGMSVMQVENIDDGMRLGVWAKKDGVSFSEMVTQDMEKLNVALGKYPKPIVIWGAAGRGGNLLAFLKLDLPIVKFVVDVNKEKQGKFIPPFGQKVVAPEDLTWIKPKTILVANKKYFSEVNDVAPSNCSVIDISILDK